MSDDEGFTEDEIRNMGEKDFRKEFPSGWMEVSRYETLVLVIDRLLETNPNREFSSQELADQSGSTKRSVENHINSLVSLGVIEELEDRDPIRYSLNEKSPITQKLFELNLTVEKVKNEELPKTLSRTDRVPVTDSESNTFDGHRHSGRNQIQPTDAAIGAD